MEDKTVKNFLCACDCKVAIKDAIIKHNISIEDYKTVLIDVKKWIDFIIED